MLSTYRKYLDKYTAKHRRKVMLCPVCRDPNKIYSPYPADDNGFPLICEGCFNLMQTGIKVEKAYSDMNLTHLCCQSYVSPGDFDYKCQTGMLKDYTKKINELIAIMVGGAASVVIHAWDIALFGSSKRTLLRKSGWDDHIHSGIKAVITTQEAADAAKELVILFEELMKRYGQMKYENGKDILVQLAKGFLPEG